MRTSIIFIGMYIYVIDFQSQMFTHNGFSPIYISAMCSTLI